MIDKLDWEVWSERVCFSVINEMAKAAKLCIIKQPQHKLPVVFIRWKPSGSLLLLFFKIDFRNGKEKLERKEQTWSLAFPRGVGRLCLGALPTSNCVQLQSERQGLRMLSRNDAYSDVFMHTASYICWQLFHYEGFYNYWNVSNGLAAIAVLQ